MASLFDKSNLHIQYSLLIFLALLLFTGQVQSQNQVEYEHTINDSINGKIKAEVNTSKDSMFVGDFEFYTTFKNEDPFKTKTSLTYQGEYAKDLKTNLWSFSYKTLKALENFKERNYQLNLMTSGKEFILTANFLNGLANDEWNAEERLFENSEVKKTIYTIDAVFKDSKMVNALKADFPDLDIEIGFDDEGYADGDWIFSHELDGINIKDIMSFQNGIFKNRKLEVAGKTINVEQLGLDPNSEKNTSIGYDKGMDEVLKLVYFNLNNEDISQTVFQKINHKSLSHLDKILKIFKNHQGIDIWQNFKGSEELIIGLFKIEKHPLSTTEKSQIKDVVKKIKDTDQKIDHILNNSYLEIGKLNYEELNIQESILDVYKNYVYRLKPLFDKLNTKEIEYINRRAILPEWLPEQNFPESITYRFKEEEFSKAYNFPKSIKTSEIDISSISKLVNKIYADILASEKKSNEIFKKLSKKEALSDREKEFVDLKKKLIALYKNENSKAEYNSYHEVVSSNFIQIVNDQFRAFANLDIDEKEQQIDDYLDCYKSLEDAYKKIEELPLRLNRVDELYSRTTFDPFMMADMTERLKSRIYNAFEDFLLPYIIDNLKTAQSCHEVEKALQLFDNTYKRLVVLIDEDTKELEKLLKRERNVQSIMEALNINPS